MTNPAGLQALQTIMQYLSQVNMSSADLVEAWNEFRVNLDNKIGPLENGSALSVFGRSANSIGPRADIVAASDHQVLRRSGTSVGFGAIDLSQANATTNALPITRGGTGQSTANPAFNALAPTTTRGDIIRRGASVNERLALGSVGQVLTSDGTDAVWGAGGQSGNWTPAIQGATTAGTYTYTMQSGRYSLIGRELHLDFQIVINAVSSAGTGNLLITGVPIAMPNNSQAMGSVLLSSVAAVPAGFSAWLLSRSISSALVLLYTNATNGNSLGARIDTVVRAGTLIRGSIDMVQP